MHESDRQFTAPDPPQEHEGGIGALLGALAGTIVTAPALMAFLFFMWALGGGNPGRDGRGYLYPSTWHVLVYIGGGVPGVAVLVGTGWWLTRRPIRAGPAVFALGAACAALGVIVVLGRVAYPLVQDPRPRAITPPTISGAAQVGATLRGNDGRWRSDAPLRAPLQLDWQQCDAALRVCTRSAHDERRPAYRLDRSDRGYRIRLRVMGRSGAGNGVAYSAATSVITG